MPLTVDDLVALVANTPSNSQFGSAEEIAAAARLQGIDDPAAFLATLGIDIPAGAAGAGLTTTGEPLNVVQGSDFIIESIRAYFDTLGIGETAAVAREGLGLQRELGFAGIGESAADRAERGRQFDITSAFQKASQLAQLQANPLSAAESAFMRAGLGLDPFSGAGGGLAGADIAAMIGGQIGSPTFSDMVQLPDGSFVPRSRIQGGTGVGTGGGVGGGVAPNTLLSAEPGTVVGGAGGIGVTGAGAFSGVGAVPSIGVTGAGAFSGVGAGGLDLGILAAPTTRGAGGTSSVTIGGKRITAPGTLSGRQLTRTAGQGAAGVIESLAAAAGNPGQRARSVAALIPTGFPG